MPKFQPILGAAGLALFLCGQVSANPNPYQISPELDQTIRAGLHELYNLKFDKARAIFNSIESTAADHPLTAFGQTTVEWWKISVDVSENDPAASQAFLESAERCIKLSEEKIEADDPDGEGHLTLGSVYALLARWEAANRNWLAVRDRAKKARKLLKRALKKNPEAADAYMALGIFNYTLTKLPKIARFFTGLSPDGDAEEGLKELEIAAEKGIYLRLPATFLLGNIYSDDLKQPFRTVEMLTHLRKEFPHSPFIDFMMFTALYNQNCSVELAVEVNRYEDLLKDGTYGPEFESQGHFMRGLAHFQAARWPEAEESFNRGIRTASAASPFKIWSMLYKGYALDVQEKRQEAVAIYQKLVAERPRWKSRDYAQKRLSEPFTPSDPEVATLLL